MARSTLSGVAFFLLSLSTASAAFTCTTKPSPPTGAVCGVFGTIDIKGDWYLLDLRDAKSTTPEGCAAACADRPTCLSFDLEAGVWCELHTGTTSQVGWTSTPKDDWYKHYEPQCFNCVNSTSTSSSASSSATFSSSSSMVSSSPPSSFGPTSSSESSSSFPTSTESSSVPTETSNSSLEPTSTGSVSISVSHPTTTDSTESPISTDDASSSASSTEVDNSAAVSSIASTTKGGYPVDLTSSASGHMSSTVAGSSSSAPAVSSPHITGSPSVSKPSEVLTTSIVYATSVETITSCAPSVTSCPVGSVTTKTVPLYTTICPVTATHASSALESASYPASSPVASSPVHSPVVTPLTTSTVYITSVYTITSCAPSVTNCPIGHVTTKTVSMYTTVCPVSLTHTKSPVPSATTVKPEPHSSAPGVPGTTYPAPIPSTKTVYYTVVQSSAAEYPTGAPSVPVVSSTKGYPTGPAVVSTVTVVPKPEVSNPKNAASSPAVTSSTNVPVYPTAVVGNSSGYFNGTTTKSAGGPTGTGSIVVSTTGYPTETPVLVSVNAGSVIGVKAWGMAVAALIALVL